MTITACFSQGKSSTHRGFSLLELLVVIATISLLVSILLPSLRAARREGKTARCIANLRDTVAATHMYNHDQSAAMNLPWYQFPAYAGYDVEYYSPWVFGGFRAPNASWDSARFDSSLYPAEIRPLNAFVDPAARDDDIIKLYQCPDDRSYSTAIIGTPPVGVTDEPFASWEANGSSYTLNTRFMQGYAGGNGDFDIADSIPYGRRAAPRLIGGRASRFVLWTEQGCYSAAYRAAPQLPNGAAPQREGWHGKFSTWTLAFADGHVRNMYYDTRLSYGPEADLWQPQIQGE